MLNLHACLRGSGTCDAAAPCTGQTWPRSCLTTDIPAWATTLGRTECCFRCCLRVWTRKLGLDENEMHWRKQGVNFWVSSGAGTLSSELATEPMESVSLESGWAMSPDSILYARFSVARFAHVQAVQWADWVALANETTDADEQDPLSSLSPRLAAPSASQAKATLIVLNGWGNGPENVSSDGSKLTHRIAFRRVGHEGSRLLFNDPLEWLMARLSPYGRHAVQYGNDHSISRTLIDSFYRPRLGHRLTRYLAPNLQAEASTLPYAVETPLGLNSNGRALEALLKGRHGARLQAQHAHRDRELLCCCMRLWIKHRVRIVRMLERNGFACDMNTTMPWEVTIERYLRSRFVLAVWGNGHQDFRMWEVLAAGAVPVIQRFAEQDALFEGLPVVGALPLNATRSPSIAFDFQ